MYMILAFILALAVGVPIALVLGLVSFAGLFQMDPTILKAIPQRLFATANSSSLMAIPLFMVFGELLELSGDISRLADFARALVGRIKGGLAYVCLLLGFFLGGPLGTANAEAALLGSTIYPEMVKDGYDDAFTASFISAISVVGPLIPPGILFVIYGVAREIGRYLRDSVVKEVEKCLDAREYDKALDMLELALRYVPEDLELVKIKEHVLEEKEYYLRNSSIRAQALLGTGDYINDDYLLMAYEIDNSRTDVFYIQGNIINKGEETVSSISICFKLYDEIGNFIDEINVPCPVKSINAGSGAYFDYTYDELVQLKWIRPISYKYTLK
jgi:sorbitol-specific phosphotransferase system component IIC